MNTRVNNQFPQDFLIGVATAAYQVEGAWNKDGKGESMWDHLTHTQPGAIIDRSNGDIACDSYHKYKEDIKLIKDIGFQMYRFSFSWTRILPNGDMSVINQKGIDYYHRVIDELLNNGIQPMVTLYHWDLPQTLSEFGGWLNPIMVDYFVDYVRFIFKEYGDKVKWWITINEPKEIVGGYGEQRFAPYLKLESFGGDYLAGHILLKAHAKAYHVYDKEFRPKQKGKITFVLNGHYYTPKNKTKEDEEASERARQFDFGWFAHPVYSKNGDYPPVMRELVDKRSKEEGRTRSRLPKFTEEEIREIRGTSDFLALNFYTSFMCSNGKDTSSRAKVRNLDANFIMEGDKTAIQSPSLPWLRVTPWAIRDTLLWLKKEYDNPTVFITENGYGDDGPLNDTIRIKYFQGYIKEVLNAMNDHGCKVIGYLAWSLLDDFEWRYGYTCKFGIVHVDFNDPERKRTPRESANFFRKMLKTRTLPNVD